MHAHDLPDADTGSWKRYVIWTSALGTVVAIIFVCCPWFDVDTASWFYLGNNQFIFSTSKVGYVIRAGFKWVFIAASLMILIGLVLSVFGHRPGSTLPLPVWLFLTCALVVGPGFVANTVFKDNWGRARPYHMEQFGGDKQFTVAFKMSDQCDRNCSFIGGESSAMFALFFALAFSVRARRHVLLATGCVAGTAAGLTRMAQGGHFASDVIVSGVAMMLVVLGLYWVFFIRYREAFRTGEVFDPIPLATAFAPRPLVLAPIPVTTRLRR